MNGHGPHSEQPERDAPQSDGFHAPCQISGREESVHRLGKIRVRLPAPAAALPLPRTDAALAPPRGEPLKVQAEPRAEPRKPRLSDLQGHDMAAGASDPFHLA